MLKIANCVLIFGTEVEKFWLSFLIPKLKQYTCLNIKRNIKKELFFHLI